MAFKTIKAAREARRARGGYLETIRDAEAPEYAPHLSQEERGWVHGLHLKAELLAWANANLQPTP